MKAIFVLTCLCFMESPEVYGASKRVLDYISMENGDRDNKEQTQQAGDDHDLIQVRFIPVDIECFKPDPVLFIELADNGAMQFMYVGVVTDGIEDTVSLRLYNFTDITKYKIGDFKVEDLANISCEDIRGRPDCFASYIISDEGRTSFGNFPFCRVTVNEKHPRFTVMCNCDACTATLPMYTNEKSTMEPYEFRTGKKYPLINPPSDYVPPCGK